MSKLDSIKKKLLNAKELRAKSRGRLDQLLDSLQAKYGVRSLVEARGRLVDLERERDRLKKEEQGKTDKLEKRVNEFFGKNQDTD